MTWYKFKIKGQNNKTKESTSLEIIARFEEIAKKQALDKGLIPPFECQKIPFEPPTEKQISLLKSLNINIPDNINKDDANCLLSRKNDISPSVGLMAFAEQRDIYFSPYIGNKDFYELIFNILSIKDRYAFFIFCIYRFLSNDKRNNLDTHPYRLKFYQFVDIIYDDNNYLKSLKEYHGSDLADIENLKKDTLLYKKIVELLNSSFDKNWHPLSTNTNANINTDDKLDELWPTTFIINKNKTIPNDIKFLQNKIVSIPLLNDPVSQLPIYQHDSSISPKETPKETTKKTNYSYLLIALLIAIVIGYIIYTR